MMKLLSILFFSTIAWAQDVIWSTYFGGTSDDHPTAISSDRAGNVIVAGYTTSTDINAGPAPGIFHSDLFVAKLNAAGKLIYYVRTGGFGVEAVSALAVGQDGSAYVTGRADPPPERGLAQLPFKNAAFSEYRGYSDTFVMKLNPEGEIQYSTLLGIDSPDAGAGIAVDAAGSAYVASQSHTTFIVGVDTTTSVYVTKLDPSGLRVVFRYRLGDDGFTNPGKIAVDRDGSIWLTGSTTSRSFPVVGAERPPVAPTHGFLAKLDAAGARLLYSTTDIEPNALLIADASGAVRLWTSTEPAYGPLMARSTDAGLTWENHDFLGEREYLTNLRFGPGGSQLYALAASDLIRSQDAGRTWQTLHRNIGQYALHPSDPQVLFAGALDKSSDGGITWKQVWFPEWPAAALLVDPASPDTVYASECSWQGISIVKLAGGGEQLLLPRNTSLGSQCPSQFEAAGGAIFVLNGDLAVNGDLLRSTDEAETFQRLLPDIRGMKANRGTLFAWNSTHLLRSTDGGDSWTELSEGVFYDLAVDPSSPDILYASADDGIRKSTDAGKSWTLLRPGAGEVSLAVDPRSSSTVYAGFPQRVTYPAKPVLRLLDGSEPPRQLPQAARYAVIAATDGQKDLFGLYGGTVSEISADGRVVPVFAMDADLQSTTTLSAMAVDPEGNILLTGSTSSDRLPVKSAIQTEYRGDTDGFIIKLAPR